MAVIVNKREFLPSFTHRVVVGESTVISTISGELRLRVLVDFGVNGRLSQPTIVSITSKSLIEVVREIEQYLDEIRTLIAGLEDFINWLTNEGEHRFLLALDLRRPVMITGLRNLRNLRMGLHGEELLDFSIAVDTRKDPGASSLCRKIEDIVSFLQTHVNDITNINIQKIVSKEKEK